MGGESNEGEMGLNYEDDESGISRVGNISVLSYAKTNFDIVSIKGICFTNREDDTIYWEYIPIFRLKPASVSNEGEMLSKGFKDEIYEAYRYDVQGIEQYYVDVVKKSGSLIHFVIFMGRLLSIKLLTSTAQDKRWISLLRRWGVSLHKLPLPFNGDGQSIDKLLYYHPGSSSGYPDMFERLFPFGDCGGGVTGQIGHFLGSNKKVESVGILIRAGESHEDRHQVSGDGVLGASTIRKEGKS
ncbi:hypothetical protein F2Q69_00014582 [Brassica cretica]|uniref:Uncharacterized protein n=1 Tax=Brassica cretica TaxID=69181 RepID=A0A8S9QXG3_BRACR|nr:hypothetical protein F2Q69_00014582 [Brassica cretica]